VKIISKLIPRFQTQFFFHEVLGAMLPLIILFFSAQLINELSGERNLERIILFASLAVGVSFIIATVRAWLTHKMSPVRDSYEGVTQHTWLLRGEHFAKLDFDYAENPEIKVKLQEIQGFENWNSFGIARVLYFLMPAMGQLVSLLGSLALLGGLFGMLVQSAEGIVLLILPFAAILLQIPAAKLSLKLFKDIEVTMPKINALMRYYLAEYIRPSGAAMDIRIFRQKNLIVSVAERLGFARNITLFSKIAAASDVDAFVNGLIGGAAYIIIGLKALGGAIGIGQVTQYVGAITTFTNSLSAFVNSMRTLMENTRFLLKLYDFLDLPAVKYQGTLTTEKRTDNDYDFEFHNVSFKYPGSDTYALRNLNLRLRIGQKMAVVGMNGSGKSTMIKLLCRLYDPTEGEITLNGIDVRKYDLREYMDLFAVAFQDFKLTAFPLGENVAANAEYDAVRVREKLREVGFINDMPLDTPLYKNFDADGVQVSGGEAQKIALARVLYRDSPLIILDEPTAALDPLAESEIYSRFDGIVNGKTAIFISHRLSSCRFCDDIAVFDEGRLIQRGSHDTLLEDEDGKYYELWNAQAQWYDEKDNS
jgi:ATP-binding cassette subfamily B protein